MTPPLPLVIVGGGPAGLAAAALTARAGVPTVVLERAARWGGRAQTHVVDDAHLNLGPHALYEAGHARRLLDALGVPLAGRRPPGTGWALRGDRLHRLPAGLGSLVTSGLLDWRDKLELAGFLARLPKLDPQALQGSVADWLAPLRPRPRALLEAFVRLATYAHQPTLPAAIAARQLQLGGAGVRYLDGGWQRLVEGIAEVARAAGADLRLRAPAAAVERDDAGRACAVRLKDGARVPARGVVLAVPPAVAQRLAPDLALDLGPPARAACLDLVLDRLPRPRVGFAIGVDAPLYHAVHSDFAALAPAGVHVVQLARYLAPGEDPGEAALEAELERAADRLQPGWRAHLRHRRWLPRMTVVEALPAGGLDRRPGPATKIDGLWLAGDWVGDRGWLLDAALASAERAAALACEPVAEALHSAA